jgi:hypothetical protein
MRHGVKLASRLLALSLLLAAAEGCSASTMSSEVVAPASTPSVSDLEGDTARCEQGRFASCLRAASHHVAEGRPERAFDLLSARCQADTGGSAQNACFAAMIIAANELGDMERARRVEWFRCATFGPGVPGASSCPAGSLTEYQANHRVESAATALRETGKR